MAKRRKRGDGGVSLRKDGRWEGRAVIGYDDKGLPVTKNVLAKTKSECIAKLKALRDSINAPTPDQPKPGILLSDWLDLWYQSYKKPKVFCILLGHGRDPALLTANGLGPQQFFPAHFRHWNPS